MPYYEKIEWEILQNKLIFDEDVWSFEFPFKMNRIQEIKIHRNEFYRISMEIKSLLDEKTAKIIEEFKTINLIRIKNKYSSEEYLIKNSNILEYGFSYEKSIGIINISLSVSKIEYNSKNAKNVAWVKEWYLNGPTSDKIIFPRPTTYTKKEVYEKELDKIPSELIDEKKFKIETNEVISTALNYIFCRLNDDDNIIIGKVPREMNPEWSDNISLSYNSEKYIYDKKSRGDIENIVSLFFGRKLIKIAESYYDGDGNKVREEIFNPFLNQKFNIIDICKTSNKLIIPIHQYPFEDVELIIGDLINSFLGKRDNIDFSPLFVNYWNSLFLPPESRIILLAASLESMKNKWFESQNSKSKGVIIDKPLYKILIKDVKELFLLIFGECQSHVDNFNQLNKLSIRKGFETFFSEIGMEVGDIELDALKARNDPVHGNDMNTETYCNLIIYAEVYQIIVNRVILMLLDYEGLYSVHDSVEPMCIYDKIPYSLEELRDEIYEMKYYEID